MDLVGLMAREMHRRKYSPRTVDAYCYHVERFLRHVKKEPRRITRLDVKVYIYMLAEKGLSGSTLNLNLQSIKFALEQILNKRLYFYNFPYSRAPKRLPIVLTKEEVRRIISAISNEKHKLVISMLYSAGLRVSELVNLRVSDLELEHNYGWVRDGKGRKDRMFIIAQKIKQPLTAYLDEQNPKLFLFEGRNRRYSPRTIAEILRLACKTAQIEKKVHPHSLRHSFATHLIEEGKSVASIQALLGHVSPQTTMVYVHTARANMLDMQSPYDNLEDFAGETQ